MRPASTVAVDVAGMDGDGSLPTSCEGPRLAPLLPLARTGAYAEAPPPGAPPDAAWTVLSPRNGFRGPVASIAAETVADARALGWIAAGGGAGRYRLTRAGRTAVKRARAAVGDPREAAAVAPAAPAVDAPSGAGPSHSAIPGPVRPRAAPRALAPSVNPCESPIAWLRRRKDKDGQPMISAEQFEAGERLRDDFWFAQMTPKVTSSWSPTAGVSGGSRAPGGSGLDMLDAVVAARARVHKAFDAVGPELVGILIDVCCHLKGLEDAERGAGWPQRSGKVILQLALTRLARHYGLLACPPGAEDPRGARPRIRHWGAEDYRPRIDGGGAT